MRYPKEIVVVAEQLMSGYPKATEAALDTDMPALSFVKVAVHGGMLPWHQNRTERRHVDRALAGAIRETRPRVGEGRG